MKQFIVFIVTIAALNIYQTNAVPVFKDVNGNCYYLLSENADESIQQNHHRHIRSPDCTCTSDEPKRETIYDINNRNVQLGQKVTIVDNDNHRLSASAYASRDFAPKGPLTTGQGAEYLHKPSGSNLQINAENTRGAGTDYKASGTYNFFQTQDKRGKVGVSGEYERHHGGPGGTSDPNYNVMLKGSYDF